MSEQETVVHRCVWCGSPHVNLWMSWNVTGEWTCDDCTPPDPIPEDWS